ncbi:MAG: nitrate/nitrite two-component system sensor histidine kinase NarX [Ewingella americana]|jgi:two-component system nitrate/nitrite sensor histidine kinase NarX|uniref:nitrate/nitrite two-component system sensor histidine kinase NarX n=1 Tax=Ewingella americana TaxID=41202 RepID=UPI00242E5D8A|nr:nitrate/nitrite two-component system sensor histidine kinase NarX [Ewingella americana]MCI1678614.1 nitrate/nitrite two-component system sensor histidine kinase NarX [Ewingella americana]MCI1854201.1 nitrate/nitrite two-component system sensor histidine kinase NarX [Ewingella americana]MCI1861501.1 nitrate/nitrite two-component system sensor histidine kinase NarX [Ewingella americana]MCI2140847.1 nitrate/nitrite two-component system sensor histidine kinase NarX [Ewingella americana]MCI21663
MLTRAVTPLSLVSQIALLMLLLGLLGIGGMSVAAWMAQSIQGNAHAINKAGSLRMQSYRLLASVPLTPASNGYLRQMEQDQDNEDLRRAVQSEDLQPEFDALRRYWMVTLKDQIRQAQTPAQVASNVAVYVGQLDKLVAALEHKTEYHLTLISLVQRGLLLVTLLLLGLTIWFLRRRLLEPWKRLLAQANAVSASDFSQRYQVSQSARPHNEMDILGQSLNSMSQALERTVDSLAQLVDNKTADLQQKNQVLDFLYRVSRQLHTSAPLERRLVPVLEELQQLTPLQSVQLRLYENNSAELFNDIGSPASGQHHLYSDNNASAENSHQQPISWSLQDERENYGVLLAQLPQGTSLTLDQQRLVTTLLEQLTSTLMLARQAEHQQQLMLMEERSAIARELHDSLAQSLSCLKIQIACLQMQGSELTAENSQLVQQMRDELNTAYRQLRELLTTFRLQMNTPGLRAALQHAVDEFSARMGITINFDYQLPPRSVPANQAIHLLHIAREALNNAFKHANATQISLRLSCEQDEIMMQVTDDGQGIPEDIERQHHYGLIIMQDRAKSLHGQCQITRRESGGTQVTVRFRPDALPINPQEQV